MEKSSNSDSKHENPKEYPHIPDSVWVEALTPGFELKKTNCCKKCVDKGTTNYFLYPGVNIFLKN